MHMYVCVYICIYVIIAYIILNNIHIYKNNSHIINIAILNVLCYAVL